MKAKQKGFSVVEILIVIVIIGLVGAVGWLVYDRQNSNTSKTSNTQLSTPQEVTKEESSKEVDTYQSKLYPSLSFTVPNGWQVNEPAKYDESPGGPGSADSEITITKGDATLSLMFNTMHATGFEGYTCYNYNDIVKVNDLYRFTNKDGITSYRAGVSTSDKDWTEASTGEYSYSEDANPNYCVVSPFIATHKSTLNKNDYPESPFNGVSTDSNDISVWVLADVTGETSKEILADTDTIISSFSKSVDW